MKSSSHAPKSGTVRNGRVSPSSAGIPTLCILRRNGVVFTQQACVAEGEQESPLTVLSRTTLAEILKFVNEVPFAAIRFILDSAKLNCALSRKGLSGNRGRILVRRWKQRGLLAKDLIHCDSYQRGIRCWRMGGATLPAMSNLARVTRGSPQQCPWWW